MAAKPRTVDTTEVKDSSGFNPIRLAEGNYRAKISDVADHKSKAGAEMWVYTISVPGTRAVYAYYVQLEGKTVWKLDRLFASAGKPLPRKRNTVDPNSIVGREIGIELEDSEYNGKEQSQITAVFAASQVSNQPEVTTPVLEADDDDIELIEE